MKNKMNFKMIALGLMLSFAVFGLLISEANGLDTTTPISLSEIASHNKVLDCWTAISGKVYDLTPFIPSHPGGSAISVICGKDGSSILDAKHSLEYAAMVSSYQIGILGTPDKTSPVITIQGSNPVNLNIGDSYTDAGAKATDNVDGDLTSSIIVTNNVDTSKKGSYLVKYKVSDKSGNFAEATRTVIVKDKTVPNPEPNEDPTSLIDKKKPKLKLLGKHEVKLKVGDSYTDAGATAFDNMDGDLTTSIIVTSNVDTTKPGEYKVKYKVSDKAGNTAVKYREVVVKKQKAKEKQEKSGSKNEIETESHENETESETEKDK